MKYRLAFTTSLVFALAMLWTSQAALAFCGIAGAIVTAVGYAAAREGLG